MPQQLRASEGRKKEYGCDHPGGQRQAQQQKSRNGAQPAGTGGARGEFQAGDIDTQLAKVAHHQAAAGVDGALVKLRGRHQVRHQQQRGKAARREAGLSAKDEPYVTGRGGQAPAREGVPAWISIAQGGHPSGPGKFSISPRWSALMK